MSKTIGDDGEVDDEGDDGLGVWEVGVVVAEEEDAEGEGEGVVWRLAFAMVA